MCGRYSLSSPIDDLRLYFEFEDSLPNLAPSYNVAPSHAVPVVRLDTGVRVLAFVRWGLTPQWAKGPDFKPLINARSETVNVKASFRGAYRHRRCLVPADGFYEWQKRDQGPKQPFHITQRSGAPFAMAGIWEDWMGSDGTEIDCMAILTTSANATLKPLHHRMPVILSPDDYDTWLDSSSEPRLLEKLLIPAKEDVLMATPVSTRVNAVVNDDADLIKPVQGDSPLPPKPSQGSLFDDE